MFAGRGFHRKNQEQISYTSFYDGCPLDGTLCGGCCDEVGGQIALKKWGKNRARCKKSVQGICIGMFDFLKRIMASQHPKR